jgi:signal peptidase I
MTSLLILLASFILSTLATAWVMGRMARLVGSPRGRFVVGLGAMLLILTLNAIIAGVSLLLSRERPSASLGVDALLLLVQVGGCFIIIKRVFSLTTKRAFAPFGGFVVVIIVQFALVLLVVRPYLTQGFVLPTSSMSPTLEVGSRFLVNKVIQPRRFDLIAYWNDGNPPQVYCKRLIGLPGESLRFSGGGIFINDQPIVLPPVLAGRCHALIRTGPNQRVRYEDDETIVLGNDEFFFIGDNVDVSLDSRSLGPSSRSSLVGVVDLIYWPAARASVIR